jgi:transcriptional regulator NrdR family protein
MSVCPECAGWKSKTLATRKDTRYNWTWRAKECQTCGHKFETYEISTEHITPPEPINPNGRLKK